VLCYSRVQSSSELKSALVNFITCVASIIDLKLSVVTGGSKQIVIQRVNRDSVNRSVVEKIIKWFSAVYKRKKKKHSNQIQTNICKTFLSVTKLSFRLTFFIRRDVVDNHLIIISSRENFGIRAINGNNEDVAPMLSLS